MGGNVIKDTVKFIISLILRFSSANSKPNFRTLLCEITGNSPTRKFLLRLRPKIEMTLQTMKEIDSIIKASTMRSLRFIETVQVTASTNRSKLLELYPTR